VICGTAVLTYSVMHGRSENPLKFFCYLVIALAASRLKVNLPALPDNVGELSLSAAGRAGTEFVGSHGSGLRGVVVQCFDRDRPFRFKSPSTFAQRRWRSR